MIDPEKFRSANMARSIDTYGVTIAAFYDKEKPPAFRQIIELVSTRLNAELGNLFWKYPLEQIHATIIGLEGQQQNLGIVNNNMQKRFGENNPSVPAMDFNNLLKFFRCSSWPFVFQIGGFSSIDFNPYDFIRRPWERTFDIRNDGLIVMMGWPCFSTELRFSPSLLGIRKYLERFGVVHKYHINPQEQDNDLFFVIGSLSYEEWKKIGNDEKQLNQVSATLERVKHEIRTSLSLGQQIIEINAENIWVVRYRRTTLEKVDFAKPILEITKEELQSLYE